VRLPLLRLTLATTLAAGALTAGLTHHGSAEPLEPVQHGFAVAAAKQASVAVTTPEPVRPDARVLRVQDGDTVVVRLRNGSVRYVRILGIDTPETILGAHECGGPTASKHLKALLPRGTGVVMRADPHQPRVDRYDRLLRYVRRSSDRLDLGQDQLSRGLAEVYVYRNGPFRKRATYERVEQAAQHARVGIWTWC
jgi:endonuclease YncB( thermonuclease family)